MGIDPFVYFEFKNALDQLELAKINAERELIGLPPLMPLSESLSCFVNAIGIVVCHSLSTPTAVDRIIRMDRVFSFYRSLLSIISR